MDGFIGPVNPAFEATVAFVPDLGVPSSRRSRVPGLGWVSRMLHPFSPVRAEAVDHSTGLFTRAALFAAAAQHLDTARTTSGITAVVLEFSDLVEVREIYGAAIARKVVAKVVRRLLAIAGVRGWAGRTGHTQFTVVLPGVDAGKALRHMHRVLGKPPRVEFDAGDSEIVLVPDFVVDTMFAGAGSVQELYRDMTAELSRMQKVERRRLHFLTSQRERHSRPMGVPG